jgi:hypothetical protein
MASDVPAPESLDAGRYDGRTAPELASQAEEALRGIAHLTEAGAPRMEPDELYRTLSALTRLVEQLPEATTRVAAQLAGWSGDSQLVVTAGPFHGDPDGAIAAANEAVSDTILPASAQLRTGFVHAQAAVGQLTRDPDAV